MTKNKKDLLLVAIILAIAAAGFLINNRIQQKNATRLEIRVDGTVIETLDLTKDTERLINGLYGGTNHLIIQEGMAWVDDATCPDKVCIHQGRIALNGQTIACLPNGMSAMVVAPKD